MSTTFALRLLPLAPLALLLACTDSRELPSAPSITAHRSATDGSDAPAPRGYSLMVHDPVKDRLYLFGGFSRFPDTTGIIDYATYDVWSFHLKSREWHQLSPDSYIGADAAALDVQSRKVIMLVPWADPIPETWAYDIETGAWENRHPAIEPAAISPPPDWPAAGWIGWGSKMVYDSESDRVLLYGGFDAYTYEALHELWAYDYESNTWTELHPPMSPPGLGWTEMVYVPTIDRVILFGGFLDDLTLSNGTWAYDFNHDRWKNLKPANPPPPHAYHTMGFEPATNRLVLFGGILDPTNWPHEPTNNDTWIYDVARNRWSQVFPKDSPSPRAWHAMAGTNGPVVLFGGGDSRWTYTNDTFLYTSRSNEWKKVAGGEREATATIIAKADLTVGTAGSTRSNQVSRGGSASHR